MDIVGLYQQLNHKLEKVDFEKSSMMDEIRSKAVKQKAKLREAYMADEMESCFKGMAMKLSPCDLDEIEEFTFTPEGLILMFSHDYSTELFTWKQLMSTTVGKAEYEEADCEPRKELGCQE